MQESPDALAQYLARQVKQEITYLSLNLMPTADENTFSFVIHPQGQNGETARFVVSCIPPALIRQID